MSKRPSTLKCYFLIAKNATSSLKFKSQINSDDFIADTVDPLLYVRSHELTVIVTSHLCSTTTCPFNKAKDQLQQLIKDLNFFIFLYGLEVSNQL